MDDSTDFTEIEDINTFIELYRKNRVNGKLTTAIKISYTEIINDHISTDDIKPLQKKCMIQRITEDFLNAILEFTDDVFHIQIKSKEINTEPWETPHGMGIQKMLMVTLYVLPI